MKKNKKPFIAFVVTTAIASSSWSFADEPPLPKPWDAITLVADDLSIASKWLTDVGFVKNHCSESMCDFRRPNDQIHDSVRIHLDKNSGDQKIKFITVVVSEKINSQQCVKIEKEIYHQIAQRKHAEHKISIECLGDFMIYNGQTIEASPLMKEIILKK